MNLPSPMVRKQIYLTAELNERLRREAKRQRRSEADIMREALQPA
jgi:predicted DNA-binding protein